MARFAKLLILDLDETLIHGTRRPLDRPEDFQVGEFLVYRRPRLQAFLEQAFVLYDVAVWTSASRGYAEGILKNVLPAGAAPRFVWCVERCTLRRDLERGDSFWIKDLQKVKRRGFRLEEVVMVDDSPEKLARSYGNLVRVRPFEGAADDDELPALSRYLELLGSIANVRAVEKRLWRTDAEAGTIRVS